MLESELQPDSDPEEDLPALAIVGSYRTSRMAHESGLAVLAAGYHYWVYPENGRYILTVRQEFAEAMGREVEIAERRNRFWPPPSLDLPSSTTSKLPTVVSIVILMAVFYGQKTMGLVEELGLNSSEAVLEDGQWWRLVTAITLHADVGHLAGNILGILIFAYLCCRYMGNGLAWGLILLAAALSNLSNDVLHAGQTYRSLGASTAVFAALGLLTGFPIGAYLRTKEPVLNRDWLIPFFGGCILFAWMGGGEFPTDVGGHVLSFVYGLAVAILVAWSSLHSKISTTQQKGLLFIDILILVVCWSMAMGNA